MIAAVLMAAATVSQTAVPQTAVDVERAFAARAQAAGQWRAFREFAAEDAVMFVPEPVKAHEWLPRQPEPKEAVRWSPTLSAVSCDGDTAVNTGPWSLAGEKLDGYFTTVWQRGAGGWKWHYDGGAPLATPRPAVAEPLIERASCKEAPIDALPLQRPGEKNGGGMSRDRSLWWSWRVTADGARLFTARIWTGEEYRLVVEDRVPPLAQTP